MTWPLAFTDYSTIYPAGETATKIGLSVPSLAPRLDRAESGLARIEQVGTLSPVSIKACGAVGDGSTDDTLAIQAAIDAFATGPGIYIPQATFIVSATLLIPEWSKIEGAGARSKLKLADGSTLATPLMASKQWYNNTLSGSDATLDNPIILRNFALDGNKANAGSSVCTGLQIFNWESLIDGLHVSNFTQDGIRQTDKNRGGTTLAASQTAIENRITRCRVSTCNGVGIYIWEQDTSTGRMTDGYCVDNICNSNGLQNIFIMRGAGWRVSGNHVYVGAGFGGSGIDIRNAFSTRVTENYIDDYGRAPTTGQTYFGILVRCTTSRGSVISNNTIEGSEATAANTYRHLSVDVQSTVTTARATISGNVIVGASQTNGTGLRVEAISGTVLHANVFGNQIEACNLPFISVATGTILGRFDLMGTGSPESAVAAPIGSTYSRLDGGAATSLYVKESGVGNTGWVAK